MTSTPPTIPPAPELGSDAHGPSAEDGKEPGASLQELLDTRFSCRGFLPRPVPRATIEGFMRIAQRTPSWCNSQPWQVIVTDGPATDRLRAALRTPEAQNDITPDIPHPVEYRGVYRERRLECAVQLYESVGVARGDREASARQAAENFEFFGAPHVALVTTEALLGAYGVLDCGAYVNNFILAARSVGVSSIPQAALTWRSRFLHAWFGIPEDRHVVCAISFGYEDATHPANRFRTSRAPLQDVLQWVAA